MTQLVRFERKGAIAVITINRPERKNAFDLATAYAMEAAIDEFDRDDELRVAVLTGEGDVFCAGQDIIAAGKGELGKTDRRGGAGIMAQPPEKPIIAAVEGHAVGGGLELCLSCDLVVASRTAKLGLPEAKRGFPAMGGGLFRLPKRIPYAMAMEAAVTGATWSAERFHELGLVNRLAEPGEALGVALVLAGEVAAAAPVAVKASKAIVRRSQEWTDTESWLNQEPFVDEVLNSADYHEGMTAFAEKRQPEWKGR
ncbi:enoyl-CoA hydratase [Prauserella marina]|uniref:Enoyl-CoA hydratase n=1 Tax=Prauserella marina TaxID=530584 RepID=A0A222VVW5_9PSEU|nr:crotonase/enoyl-CoA hydratase family protein [Prauserella marina]ASR38096.1 enoyl-CoA hydratase [Prauserella marina]PWV78747.1 short chain enoyl-CoA hydratase [Prauserella marina]SDC92741.1 enoyl-CoA hydratase [Prauserella marina]